LITTPGENQVIADLAEKAAARTVLTLIPGQTAGIVLNDGQHLEQIDLKDFEEFPRYKRGTVKLTDADSFVQYVNRHASPAATTLWSNVDSGTITAILNDHEEDREADKGGAGLAGRGDHRATLTVKDSPDWEHWVKLDNKLVGQTQFAEHIEDGTASIKKPDAASMLELAQSFQANTKVDFKSGQRLDSGEVKLQYEETTSATAGRTGAISIPTMLELELQVFEGGAAYKLSARFMYRITNGQLALGYRLIRPDVARREAFDDIAAIVSTGTGLHSMAGTPRS
jgi:uncharacterized protein YfdQ (DUF2303 family)